MAGVAFPDIAAARTCGLMIAATLPQHRLIKPMPVPLGGERAAFRCISLIGGPHRG
jgi:hypothetical protein